MMRVAVTDGMAKEAVKKLENAGCDVIQEFIEHDDLVNGALAEFDAVIVRSATKLSEEMMQAGLPRLKVIARAGVGVDNIDVDAASRLGLPVVNAPRASTQSVVELTIGHLLGSLRFIPRADRSLRSGQWAKKELKGTELFGKRLGLIGFGRIAQGVAKVAQAFGMEVHSYDPYLPLSVAKKVGVTMHKNVDNLFKTCTHITVHCNLTDETHHLINHKRISMMPGVDPFNLKCGNHIVNCARGGIVDEDAALAALNSGQLTSLALDVFEHEPVDPASPLLEHMNFHGTPHIGAATIEAQHRVGLDIAEAVLTVLHGGIADTTVNRDALS
ncbi:MAG: phosphoglycerate dehydrogenase [Euryarchaeota archaeon]|nr:phosphoglycerate dehydrogenase [Euryarchaeota archaeon]|tara:strand:- start:5911 stop:6897 length:987 start_codon:yes stop_codon:yes gene_type:complete